MNWIPTSFAGMTSLLAGGPVSSFRQGLPESSAPERKINTLLTVQNQFQHQFAAKIGQH
jgi:hypothetical protein